MLSKNIYYKSKKLRNMIFDFFNSLIEGIAIYIITSIGAFFLGSGFRWIINQLKIRRLKQFFGKSSNNPDQIKLIVPVLHPREDVIDGKVIYHYKKPFDNEIKAWSGPENVMAVADIKAAASLMSLLEPLTPQAKEPITDEDSLDYEDGCLICIGSPLSNSKAKLLMEDVEPSVLSWVKTPKDPYNQLLQLKSGKEFTSTKTEDYGLILKIENKHSEGDFAFIIGGITHFGTIAAARFLKKNWKKLNNKADRNPFICVIQVDKINMERLLEVHFETIEKSF